MSAYPGDSRRGESYDKFEAALPAFPELVTLKEIVSAEQRPITFEELKECNEVQHVTRRGAVKPNLRAENPVAETSQPEPIPRFQLDKPSEDEVIKQLKRKAANISFWGLLMASENHRRAVLEVSNARDLELSIRSRKRRITIQSVCPNCGRTCLPMPLRLTESIMTLCLPTSMLLRISTLLTKGIRTPLQGGNPGSLIRCQFQSANSTIN